MDTLVHVPPIAETPIERDPRWASVAARDRAADGTFYYSVRTTGVYCRPSCAARLANPRNVAFHATPADAERAGFRRASGASPTSPHWSNCTPPASEKSAGSSRRPRRRPSLAYLAGQAGLSPYHFHRVFKAVTGLTPKGYAMAQRTRKVRDHLQRSNSVTEAIYESGFNSSSRFYEKADAMLGMQPRAFRAGGANADIHFAIGACSLGAILVACSDKGVCAILLGDDPEALLRDVQDRFPNARLLAAMPGSKRWSPRSSALSRRPVWAWICRSTCAAPRSSSGSGRPLREIRRRDRELSRGRRADRGATAGTRGGGGLRGERTGGRHSVHLVPAIGHRREPGIQRAAQPATGRAADSRIFVLAGGQTRAAP